MSASLSSVRKAKPARANNRRGETLWSIRLIRTKLVFAVTAVYTGMLFAKAGNELSDAESEQTSAQQELDQAKSDLDQAKKELEEAQK